MRYDKDYIDDLVEDVRTLLLVCNETPHCEDCKYKMACLRSFPSEDMLCIAHRMRTITWERPDEDEDSE